MIHNPKQVEEIFSAALEKSSIEEREKYLSESCAEDTALRQRVECLLRAHLDARNFLQALIPNPKSKGDVETLDVPPRHSSDSTFTFPHSGQTVSDDVPPPFIPGYDLLGELGRGAMGVIYKARQLDLNRLVALKMLLAGSHAGSIDLVRFHSEAEVVASLQHPNIVQVHAIGKHSGLPFLSLEYVGGGTLSARLNGVPQLPKDAAGLVEILARAVHHAHHHGIVHRDLKPSNILMSADGTPKIADFGLAKRVKSGQGMTLSGAVLGTPNYMAPEQAESKKDIGPAADIYSLGAIFYEMLTGRPPFQGPTPMDTILQVIADEPVSPRRLQPKLSRDLETICLKCLQKAPTQRYPSAEALAEDLTRYREGRPILARPVSSLEHVHRWCRRNPVVATLSAVCLAGVIVAALLLSQERSNTLSNLNRAESAERDLRDQLGLTIQAEQALTEQLWKSYSNTADAKRSGHGIGQRFESLEALAKAVEITRKLDKGADVTDDMRKKAISSLILPDLHLEKELPGWSQDMTDYTIDKRFERYALRDKEGSISVRRVADGQEFLKLSAAKQGRGGGVLSFSPNGCYLALDDPDQQVSVWDLERGQSIEFSEVNRTLTQAFSLDSRHIIFVLKDGTFGLYDLPSGKLVRRIGKEISDICTIAFHPDCNQFAALFPGKEQGVIQFWSLDSGRPLGSITKAGNVHLGSFSPDGRLLAVSNHGDSRIFIWDVQHSRKVGTLEGHKNSGIKVAFNPTYNLVASTGWENMLRLWDPLTGRQLLSMTSIEHPLVFNDRGDRILLNPERPQIWNVAGSREHRTFSGDPFRRNKTPFGGSFSPDGRLLAVGSEDGTVIWEMATGFELAYLRTGVTWHVLFHTSGDLLTSGKNGLVRWRIRSKPERAGEYRIDPPEQLIKEPTDGIVQSTDGRTVAVALSSKGCQIIDLDRPRELKPLFPHPGINKCSVSPDGTWVATGCFHGSGIKIWSVHDHQFMRDLPIEGAATPNFSADGRWLATHSGIGLQLWKVGTWELGPAVPNGRSLFSPDGSHLALVRNTAITLMDPSTGRTFATLEDPNQDRIDDAFFSPEGSQLVTSNAERSSVHVWDLRLIRSGLKAIDLDWELPPYSEPTTPHSATGPLKMSGIGTISDQSASQVDPGKKAVLDLYLNPFDADAHLRLGDLLLKAGKSESGRAHLLAALAFDPNLAKTSSSSVRAAFQMSGEALVRQSRWKEASADFVRLVQLEPQNSYRYLQAATLLLVSDDRAGYRRMAKRMLDRFRNTNVPFEADHTAKACLITGDFQSEQAALARLAEVAETLGRNANSYRQYYQFCRGLSEYRQGQYTSALEWFARSRKTNAEEVNPILCPIAMNNLFEAMALHKLGRPEEANRSMATAVAVIDNFGGATTNHRSDWHEWLLCDFIRKEAEQLLDHK